MRELNTILSKATANVGGMYFHLHIDGGDAPIFRERVYCYELYHQMRLLWPKTTKYFLNGEVDKAAHPILREIDADNAKPDLLVHTPGFMTGNYAIIEVKHICAQKRGIIKDIGTITKFIDRVSYQRGIYLIYGDLPRNEVASKVSEAASEAHIDIRNIELWHHKEVGKKAVQIHLRNQGRPPINGWSEPI
jgi:hypothetical protein